MHARIDTPLEWVHGLIRVCNLVAATLCRSLKFIKRDICGGLEHYMLTRKAVPVPSFLSSDSLICSGVQDFKDPEEKVPCGSPFRLRLAFLLLL